jgi:hypothetical protein
MTGLAERIEVSNYAAADRERSEWAPFRAAVSGEENRVRSRLSGFGVLAAFLLFSGVTVAAARGEAGIVERYGISEESLIVAAWMLQGVAALFCFVLTVRWLRS